MNGPKLASPLARLAPGLGPGTLVTWTGRRTRLGVSVGHGKVDSEMITEG